VKYFRDALKPFKVKSRSNPVWPGNAMEASDTTYLIAFYKNTEEAKKILKEKEALNYWGYNSPADLAFFKGDVCWFYSVSHEDIAGIIHADDEDIDFIISKGLASGDFVEPYSSFYDKYNEKGLSKK
jgi:hypothetical protein